MGSEEHGGFMRGFLVGTFIGALVGVLFAPKSGKELREELKEKGDKAFGEAKHFYGEAREKSRAILEDAAHGQRN